MTTVLDKLRSMAGAARRDSLISTAEADILDFLARVAEYEEDERIDGALEELADNLRRALDKCVDRDDDAADDIPSTGCPTCDAVLDTLAECHGMSLRGPTAADVAESARDWIGDLVRERDEARADINRAQALIGAALALSEHGLVYHVERLCEAFTAADGDWHRAISERDEARAEVERLRAEVASLRPRPTRDELADYARRMRADDAPDTDEPDDGWEPGPWWVEDGGWDSTSWHVLRSRNDSAARVLERKRGWSGYVWSEHQSMADKETMQPTCRAAMRWCESQPEMADVRAAYTSAPTVGATDAGPDAPALIVEGDDGTGAREARAVPAAPVSGAEQSCGETGVDRPRDDLRGPDTEDDR